MMIRSVDVLKAGSLTTVQDRGRIGLAQLAVPRSGALDAPAWRLANRLVGNPEDAAALETTLTGPVLRPRVACHIAVTGAWSPVLVDGRPGPWGIPIWARPGQVVEIGTATRGLRSYIAISGGLAVDPVLGSRSTDLLSGLGPSPLRDGDLLPLGTQTGPPAAIDYAPYPPPPTELKLRIVLGPRHDWFTDATLAAFTQATYTVTTYSNRIALRLEGPPLQRRHTTELPSEPVVTGAIEVPSDGNPLIFLNDHPTTAGYPVVAVVAADDLAACAQARPGTTVRLWVRPAAMR
ncbi:5-oxoprolinase subunit C family protein [Actinacidiphila oryziradicis]|uniref:Biotin-dependent carboxyltransferase family protein n=1 Tax=Actinacidiphila oryziradicis TaxID=2571141 RepID=A0A4V6WJ11_9ACTN|nr:biotin-dependent carboxyltransferase family protein [Actinacidiphila oryziradicis]TKA01169.1 biotin-dependent carboxyltransferase family protein [Actinacidiphila oryziradicis]